MWGYWPTWGFSEFGVFWVRQFGGEFLDEAGKKVLLDSAEARDGFLLDGSRGRCCGTAWGWVQPHHGEPDSL